MNSKPARRARRVTLATRIWEPEPAAAAFRLRSLAGQMRHLGARVQVHTSTPPPKLVDEAKRADQKANFKVRRHRVLRGADGYLRGYFQYLSFDVPLFFHLLLEKSPDIYVCEPPPTTGIITRIVSTLKRRPYVYYAADIWSDASESANVPGFVVSALRFVEGLVLKEAALVIAVNDEVASRAKNLGARNVETVRNGVDTTIFRPDGPGSPLRGERYFVYAGTMSEWQGSEVFLDAFVKIHREFPDAKLVFVGQGNAVDELRQTIDEHGMDKAVTILQPVSPEEAAAYQRDAVAALVSIKPGIGYDMAFPTKTMASWACGTPVIYAGAGPARDPLEANKLGWAVGYDADAIATAMKSALRDPQDSMRIAEWAKSEVSLQSSSERAAQAILRSVE
ncbi:glycosyltransferase family 4 protein [Flaviflexus massiliensis]|uniref:glycosyltransferase family 4 protein n=1 Tax=Flaviflexus massiliensis TaxID=1522309 RepID=UPI00097D093D|nr:glycosyltransferase family 4 protein [Flaviflexus massiliensis]